MAFGRLSVHFFVLLLYCYIYLCGHKYIKVYCVQEISTTSLQHGQYWLASYLDSFPYLFVLRKRLRITRRPFMELQKSNKWPLACQEANSCRKLR